MPADFATQMAREDAARRRRQAQLQAAEAQARDAAAKAAGAIAQEEERRKESVARQKEAEARAREEAARAARELAQEEERRRAQMERAQIQARSAAATEALAKAAASAAEAHGSSVFQLTNRLNGGEISPLMRGQVEVPRYRNGAVEMANMVPMPQGGATRRPGTVLWGTYPKDEVIRLVPFHFSSDEKRLLVLHAQPGAGSSTMDVWLHSGARPHGGVRLGVSLGLPFAAAHLREISFVQSADVLFYAHRSYPPGKISRHADTDWRHEIITWQPDIDPPDIVAVVPAGVLQKNDNQRTSYTYVATSVSAETGRESVPSAPFAIDDVGVISNAYTMTVVVSSVPGAAYYRVYREYCGVFGFVGTIPAEDAVGP